MWDRVHAPEFSSDMLRDPLYAPLITRNPTPEERDAICSGTQFLGFSGLCSSVPIAAIVDLRLRNSAFLRTRGFDLAANYRWETPWGEVNAGVDGSWVLEFSERRSASEERVNLLDTQNHPIGKRKSGSDTGSLLWGIFRYMKISNRSRRISHKASSVVPCN
jgi:hypothetical protein